MAIPNFEESFIGVSKALSELGDVHVAHSRRKTISSTETHCTIQLNKSPPTPLTNADLLLERTPFGAISHIEPIASPRWQTDVIADDITYELTIIHPEGKLEYFYVSYINA